MTDDAPALTIGEAPQRCLEHLLAAHDAAAFTAGFLATIAAALHALDQLSIAGR
jgi:hypothetical protein